MGYRSNYDWMLFLISSMVFARVRTHDHLVFAKSNTLASRFLLLPTFHTLMFENFWLDYMDGLLKLYGEQWRLVDFSDYAFNICCIMHMYLGKQPKILPLKCPNSPLGKFLQRVILPDLEPLLYLSYQVFYIVREYFI